VHRRSSELSRNDTEVWNLHDLSGLKSVVVFSISFSAFTSPLPPHDARVHAVAHMVISTFAQGELIPGAERHEKLPIS
jgi:hypothetical protein